MINSITASELNKIKAKMTVVDNTTVLIEKQGRVSTELIEGHFYIFKVSDSMLNPPKSSTIPCNFNQGRIPKSQYMMGQLLLKASNMLQFNCVGYSMETGGYLEDTYKGMWFTFNGVEIIRELRLEEI